MRVLSAGCPVSRPGGEASGQTRQWPDTPVARHASGQTRQWPDTPVARHASGQTRQPVGLALEATGSRPRQKHAQEDGNCTCVETIIRLYSVRQTGSIWGCAVCRTGSISPCCDVLFCNKNCLMQRLETVNNFYHLPPFVDRTEVRSVYSDQCMCSFTQVSQLSIMHPSFQYIFAVFCPCLCFEFQPVFQCPLTQRWLQ